MITRILLLIGVFALANCSRQATEPLRIGTNVWPGYEPLYLARELGYYDDDPVHLVEYSAATEVIRAFRNGAIDAAALTLDEVLLLAQHGLQPRIVLIMDFSHGGDAVISQPDIESLSDIKSRKVGVEDSALGAFMLQRTLDQIGLDYSEVNVVPLAVDRHERAFMERQVDAVVTFEPVRSKLILEGGRELFNSAQIPGEIVDVLVVSERYAEKYPHMISSLLKGWFQALDYMKQEPEQSAGIMALREGLTAAQFQAALETLHIPSLEENRRHLEGATPGLLTTAERLQAVMIERGLQMHRVPLEDLFGVVNWKIASYPSN
jgi:NitT/TauT family transport system substrate-binding protein